MKEIHSTLVRHAYLKDCTLGYLFIAGKTFATLEEAWIQDPDGPGGQKREGSLIESCVPDGEYILMPHDGAKWQDVWCLVNTSIGVYRQPKDIPPGQKYGRAACLIGHPGNTTKHIEGCILVGSAHGMLEGLKAVYNTTATRAILRDIMGTENQQHRLTIRPTYGTSEVIP